MADQEHLKIIRQGIDVWNDWREMNLKERADLSEADLLGANLSGADLRKADLRGANLSHADLLGAFLSEAFLSEANLTGAFLSGATLRGAHLFGAILREAHLRETDLSGAFLGGADLSEADLRGAYLSRPDLSRAHLIATDLRGATLTGSYVYGVSVWNIKMDGRTQQRNLIITNNDEPVITVDNIKVAQFIYLLITNKDIRDVIDTLTSKAVLILGRFTPPERKEVLDALHTALRKRGFVPITFDFERPTNKDFTETIMTLAGMSCFIIADITNPESSPLELQATVPNYMVPFVPIIQQGEKPFSMFRDLHNKYKQWTLPLLEYDSSESLVATLKKAIIEPALKIRCKLELIKAQELPTRHVSEYLQRMNEL
jgi:Pentapeptide repeats (8 copies)